MRTSCHRLLTDLRLSGVPGVGFVPFWCSGHGDCHDDSYYDAPTSAAARGWFSDSGGWEMIWHASCDVSDWSAAWPSGAPCTEYWDADGTVYVHFADADFCCVAYAAGSSSPLGAMPRTTRYWPDLSTAAGEVAYAGDAYSGPAQKFTMDAGGIKFFYYALSDGTPIAQGEGATYDKDDNWNYPVPFPLYHEYESFNATNFADGFFAVPAACAATTNMCLNP